MDPETRAVVSFFNCRKVTPDALITFMISADTRIRNQTSPDDT